MSNLSSRCASIFTLFTALSGCALPAFNVKYEEGGPTSRTIVQRITCELVDMIKLEDPENGGLAKFLISGDYVTSMTLSLQVTRTGVLAPNIRFPIVGPNLSLNAGFKLSNSVKRTSYKELRFSMKALRNKWLKNPEFGSCPEGTNFNLTGELGLNDLVRNEFSSRSTATSAGAGKFGGSISFTVVKNINSAGPTWTFTNFVGPGRLGKIEKSNFNKLTIAFNVGSKPEDRQAQSSQTDINAADEFLKKIEILQIGDD